MKSLAVSREVGTKGSRRREKEREAMKRKTKEGKP